MPTVSVCIPAYRQPEVLLRTVRSVLMQEGCEFELVITDDSDDDSVEQALLPCLSDARVRYFRNPVRLGAIGNWNASVEKSTGDIIKILHHDDWFEHKTALACCAEPILSGEGLVVFSACRDVNFNGEELATHCATAEQLAALLNQPECLVFANFIGAPSVVTFSRSVFVRFDERYIWLSDIDFFIRLLRSSKRRMRYIQEPLINVNAGSPAQLSRECEAQQLRSVKENIALFVAHGVQDIFPSRVGLHFAQIAHCLTAEESVAVIFIALKLRASRIAFAVFQGRIQHFVGKVTGKAWRALRPHKG